MASLLVALQQAKRWNDQANQAGSIELKGVPGINGVYTVFWRGAKLVSASHQPNGTDWEVLANLELVSSIDRQHLIPVTVDPAELRFL
ncbi:MAG: hypothetical protein H7Y12_13910 [Sphingobacteriaceae bacterium]|nr:hypothetical protein [Cytophagaceae bacterium]